MAETNIAAMQSDYNGVCNVATGKTVTLLELIEILEKLCGSKVEKIFDAPREGDIVHSAANVERMKTQLHFSAQIDLQTGLQILLND